MNENNIFKLCFLALLILVFIVRGYFGFKQRHVGQSSWSVDDEAVEREGRWSLILRPVVFLFMLALIILYIVEPSRSEWLYITLAWQLRIIAVFLGLGGILLLVWTHHELGIRWSTTLQFKEDHTLITSGPYGLIRHPMYTSLFIIFASLAIVSSFWPLWILVLLMLLFFIRIVKLEEEMMIDQFGEVYEAYIKSTGCFFPRLHRRNH
jgi:protein-S-isoprenylcysteine O-methyltransferase Ste14